MRWSIFARKRKEPDPRIAARGRSAIDLLRSDTFHECMETLEKDMWEQWYQSPADDKDAREVLYTHIKALGYIKQQLETYAQQGKLAERQMQVKEGKK